MEFIGYSTLSNNKELEMKQEINWISLWMLICTTMVLLCLSYVTLNHEIEQYGANIISIYLLSTILPYIVWKYNQINFVQKRSIVIRALH